MREIWPGLPDEARIGRGLPRRKEIPLLQGPDGSNCDVDFFTNGRTVVLAFIHPYRKLQPPEPRPRRTSSGTSA